MAPLIDGVFLLLIFFLVATTLKKIDEELPMTVRDARSVVEVGQHPEPLALVIDHEGGIFLNDEAVNETILQQRLKAVAASTQQPKISVNAHGAAPFHQVLEILDMIRLEGMAATGISTHRSHRYGRR